MQTIKQAYKPIEPTSCLEGKLFRPIGLLPGIGFLTSLNRILNYNSDTKDIRDKLMHDSKYSSMNIENPETRDIKRTNFAGLMTLYHTTSLVAIGQYYHIGEKFMSLLDKLF